MRKFYDSGLYQPPFFRKYRIEYNRICSHVDDISYNHALLSNYYQDSIEDEDNEDTIREIVEEILDITIELPETLKELRYKKKEAIKISNEYELFVDFMISRKIY